MVVASVGSWIYVSAFYVVPLLLILSALFLWDANLFAIIGALTWMGLGVFMGAAVMAETQG